MLNPKGLHTKLQDLIVSVQIIEMSESGAITTQMYLLLESILIMNRH